MLTPEMIERIEAMLELGPVTIKKQQPTPHDPAYLIVEGTMMVDNKTRRRQGVIHVEPQGIGADNH